MSRRWEAYDGPRLVLAGLAAVVAVVFVYAAATSTAAFGAYNPAWDGSSDVAGVAAAVGTETTVVESTDRYGTVEPDGAVALVLSPRTPYRPADAARIEAFVAAGGTVLVADDYGPYANELLREVGADARIDGRPLRDDHTHYRSPALPVATDVTTHPLTTGTERLTLNHGTAVRPNGAQVLVRTSGFAYLDANRNARLDSAESVGSYPVASVEAVGAGRVVVLGDPSALINVMLERPGNRAFLGTLLGTHERALLDVSHAEPVPPLAAAVLRLRQSILLQAGLGVLLVAGFVLADRWIGASPGVPTADADSPTPSRAEMVAYLEARHPEWDPARVRRLVEGIKPRRTDSSPDE